jgi:hypothetical protein
MSGYQLAGRVRPVPGDDGLVGKPRMRRGRLWSQAFELEPDASS